MGLFDLFKKKEKVHINVELGEIKKLEDITLEDMKKYPIWVNDLSGESINGYDETSERPVLNKVNLSKDFVKQFVSISFLAKIPNTERYVVLNYERDGSFSSLCEWKNGEWLNSKSAFPNLETIEIESKIEIESNQNAEINYNLISDKGELKKGV